jgi:CRP/FNR family transcriptional regulator
MLGQAVSIQRDEVLFCEGDPADAVYAVISGTVRCCKLLPDGRRQIVGFHEAGDLLGLSLSEDCPHSAEGVTDARLKRLSRAQLESLAEQRPQLRSRLFAIAAGALAGAQVHMLLLGRKTARERICSFLAARAAHGRSTVQLPMSRTDIADYLGLTIETVSRTLSQLRTAGIIRMAGLYSLELADPERLSELSEAA